MRSNASPARIELLLCAVCTCVLVSCFVVLIRTLATSSARAMTVLYVTVTQPIPATWYLVS